MGVRLSEKFAIHPMKREVYSVKCVYEFVESGARDIARAPPFKNPSLALEPGKKVSEAEELHGDPGEFIARPPPLLFTILDLVLFRCLRSENVRPRVSGNRTLRDHDTHFCQAERGKKKLYRRKDTSARVSRGLTAKGS